MPRGKVFPNAKKFTERRGHLGLSQMQLFEMTPDVSLKKISDIEAGKPTTRATLEKFVAPLQLKSVDELIQAEGHTSASPTAVSPVSTSLPEAVSGGQPTDAIRASICSFDTFIEKRTQEFVGREFLKRAVDEFIGGGKNPSGYLFIEGVPGIGKSAFLAQLIKERNYRIYHFNRAGQKINTAGLFLRNVCARLIVEFGLRHDGFPKGAFESGEFLEKVLSEASKALPGDAYLVILIDALDEVDRSTLLPRENLLYLPEALPDRVYVIATTRPLTDLPLRVAYSPPPFLLEANSPENRQDAKKYIEAHIDDTGVQEWMVQQGLTREACISLLLDKSEANFMYLVHVLPAIASGWLKSLDARQLPTSLDDYYHEHWRHMRSMHPEFDQLHKPVICALASLKEADTVEALSKFASEAAMPLDPGKVSQALQDLREYLDVGPASKEEAERAETEEGETVYRLYHNRFRDFLASGEVDYKLKEAGKRIRAYIKRIVLGEAD